MKTAVIALILILITPLWLHGPRPAAAQQADELWSPPDNISETGTAVSPFMIIDANGATHLFWRDSIDGFMYAVRQEGVIGQAQPIRLPFSAPPFSAPGSQNFSGFYTPQLAADAAFIHAIWTDSAQTIFYSRSPIANLTNADSWLTPTVLDTAAAAPQIFIDSVNNIQVAYVKQRSSPDRPAGIYHRRYNDQTAAWSAAELVYPSNYLRPVAPEQLNVRLAAAEGNQVYLAWDNPLLGMIFFARSTNGGSDWSDPIDIAQRQSGGGSESISLAGVEMRARGQELHLTWRAQQGMAGCEQYHQWSVNGGQTWREPVVIFSDPLQCPTSGRLFASADGGLLFLLSALRDNYYLQVWFDEQWSEAAVQEPMSLFVNEQTFRQISLGCVQTAVTPANQLLVLGCSSSAPLDIWLRERPLGQQEDWLPFFPLKALWTPPQLVAGSGAAFLAPQLLSDGAGNFHALWIGSDDTVSARTTEEAIGERTLYYVSGSQGVWSRRAGVRQIPEANQLTAQIVGDDLFTVWRSGDANSLLFSQAALSRAAFPSDWAVPREIAGSPLGVSSPRLHFDPENEIFYLVYIIPINEGRGIYLTQSADGGENWSEPTQVFDAVAANWAKLDGVQLAQTADGGLHLLWLKYSLAESGPPLGVYYARSADGGTSWSEAELVTEQPVNWQRLTAVAGNRLMRLWRETSGGRASISYQISTDGGENWSRSAPIVGNAPISGRLQLTADNAGNLHLIEMQEGALLPGEMELTKWVWGGDNWALDSRQSIQANWPDSAADFVAAINSQGQLTLIYPQEIINDRQTAQIQLLAQQRSLTGDGIVSPEPMPETEAAAMPTAVVQPTPTAQPDPLVLLGLPEEPLIPEPDEPARSFSIGPLDASTTTGRLLIGAIPAALIVLAVFGFSFYIAHIKQR